MIIPEKKTLLLFVSLMLFAACDPVYRVSLYVDNKSTYDLNIEYQEDGPTIDGVKDEYEKKTVLAQTMKKTLITSRSGVLMLSKCYPFTIKFFEVADINHRVFCSQEPIDNSLWKCSKKTVWYEIFCDCTFTMTEDMLVYPDEQPDSDSIDSADTDILEVPESL